MTRMDMKMMMMKLINMGLLGIDRCCFVFKCNEVWARPAKKGSLCLIGNTANFAYA